MYTDGQYGEDPQDEGEHPPLHHGDGATTVHYSNMSGGYVFTVLWYTMSPLHSSALTRIAWIAAAACHPLGW